MAGKIKLPRLYLSFIVALSCIAAPNIFAAPGDLDLSFGTGGIVASQFQTNFELSVAKVLVQPDGKIITAEIDNNQRSVIVRYNPNGSLDTGFGSNGTASFPFDAFALPRSAAIQPDGKILMVCACADGFAVVRFNPNGTPDTTFSGDGLFTSSIQGLSSIAYDVAIQPDGKILLAGNAGNLMGTDYFAVARLNANGTFDNTFGSNGVFTIDFGLYDFLFRILLQPDGKILISGLADVSATNPFGALVRLNTNGTRDASFGNNGVVTAQTPDFTAAALSLQPDGKILFSGAALGSLVYFRFTSSGQPDTSFGTNGKSTITSAQYSFAMFETQLQPDGKIIAAGISGASEGEQNWMVSRTLPNGALDTSFGIGGFAHFPFGADDDTAYSLALQADGKIVVVGADVDGAMTKTKLIRLSVANAPSSSKLDFDGDSKTDISIFRPSVGEWYYLSSLNGNSPGAQFGASSDKIAPADYTGDGKADFAFFRPSDANWYIIRSENSTFFAFPYGANGDIPAPGDFDGDGKADATIFRPSSGLWASLRSSDNQSTILQFGANGDIPVVADYDGDGKADFSVYRPSAGEWYTRRSSTGAVFGAPFGAVGDKPVQGDYTGDGKADFAVFRPSSGFWYVLRSEDQSFFGSPFGNSSDTPTIGDYDGDGKNDFAVFRPSTGNWFIQRSSNGSLLAATFGIATDRPAPAYYLP